MPPRGSAILLDPKHKPDSGGDPQGMPLKADVDKMHAYRDAIRTVEGAAVVELAATSDLYPDRTAA